MTVRVALTETINAFADMPANSEDLPNLAGHLEDIRRAKISHNLELIEEAAQRGAMIVGLGELFSAPYFALHRDPMWRVLAEDATRSKREIPGAALGSPKGDGRHMAWEL